MSIVLRLLAFCLIFSLAACSGGAGNSRIDYDEAKSLGGLEVPPELVTPVNTGTTELPSSGDVFGKGEVLPKVKGVRIARDGIERWLVTDLPVEELWPRLRIFWSTIGLALKEEKPELGIMETTWAENRADVPTDFITEMVKKVFASAYGVASRDKYRLRLERTQSGGSEIIVTHYGLQEVSTSGSEDAEEARIHWEPRPSDRELSNEVLNRIVLFLGGSEGVAEAVKKDTPSEPERARIEADALFISEGFARSWRRTGIALDRIGLVVEDRNRARGIYYVKKVELLEQEEEKGWFSSLFSSSEAEQGEQPQLQVILQGDDARTRLTVHNMDGSQRTDKLGSELLKRLQQELK